MGVADPAAKSQPAKGKCPICGASQAASLRPFCSQRCADVDLSRWLRGAYAIPATEAEDDEKLDEAARNAPAPESGRRDEHS